MIIPLRDALLRRFSNLPAGFGSPKGLSAWAHRADTLLPPGEERTDPCLFGLAPCGVYPAASITGRAVRSYRTFSPLPQAAYGLTEASHQLEAVHSLLHLPSRGLETSVPDVIRHTALRSSDFPPPPNTLRRGRQRSSSRLQVQVYPTGCLGSGSLRVPR